MKITEPINIFWLRRDLRLDDNVGLYHALKDDLPVLLVFIFDTDILDDLEDKKDARVSFIYGQILALNTQLAEKGTSLIVKYGRPEEVWKGLLSEYPVKKVYANHDYEPYAIHRDDCIARLLKKHGIVFQTFKDQVLLEKNEVVKGDGHPYIVFTPYSRHWRNVISNENYEPVTSALKFNNFAFLSPQQIPKLHQIGFERSAMEIPPNTLTESILKNYKNERDFPAHEGTSRLGLHLRFGTVSIRRVASKASELSETFLNELIWREFYQMILWHFPRVVTENFQSKYDGLRWRNNTKEFDAWRSGNTGYPLVDAGMRELNTTGFMHNRVRMVTASFLTKHLLIDWRWGEAYFAKKLLDYELASNNGGWQWAAGTGVDAAPYFRVFNPDLQVKKFDPDHAYIKKWVPEFQSLDYPCPIVDHKMARERAIATFRKALEKNKFVEK